MNARVPLDRAIASATCIPHPRQEPAMSTVDKTTASDAEWEQRVEVAARVMHEVPAQPGVYGRIPWGRLIEQHRDAYRQMAAAALTADAALAGQHTTDEEGR